LRQNIQTKSAKPNQYCKKAQENGAMLSKFREEIVSN
jgi:hypothetical protein